MKKLMTIGLVSVLALSLLGCNSGKSKEAAVAGGELASATTSTEENKDAAAKASTDAAADKTELIVFAAASMTETLNELKAIYEQKNPGVELIYTFDSSGTLKTQIDEGADCDIFISAATKQMDGLDPAVSENVANPISTDSRINLLENKVSLAVAKGNAAGITGFEDIGSDKVSMVALGNADVPVGQYSEELLTNLGIWDKIQNKISFGANVKEVTAWVAESAVECGIVYQTDAFSADLEVVDVASETEIKTPVIYPAAILEKSEKKTEAAEFLSFLRSEEAKPIFEKVGFTFLG